MLEEKRQNLFVEYDQPTALRYWNDANKSIDK
jgi:hypothetical protein